jgi:hypothetical protein
MAKDTLNQLSDEGCSEKCWKQDDFLFTAQEINDKLDDIMRASCAQEISWWQGTWESPSLSQPTQ